MAWRQITTDDVLSAMTAAEADQVNGAWLASGQADPTDTVIGQVTGEVRDAIRSCQHNVLHENASYLPEGSIPHAVAIIRHRLLSRLAVGSMDQAGDTRTKEYDTAQAYLRVVAACKRYVESGGEGASTTAPRPTATPRISGRSRRFTRTNQLQEH